MNNFYEMWIVNINRILARLTGGYTLDHLGYDEDPLESWYDDGVTSMDAAKRIATEGGYLVA